MSVELRAKVKTLEGEVHGLTLLVKQLQASIVDLRAAVNSLGTMPSWSAPTKTKKSQEPVTL